MFVSPSLLVSLNESVFSLRVKHTHALYWALWWTLFCFQNSLNFSRNFINFHPYCTTGFKTHNDERHYYSRFYPTMSVMQEKFKPFRSGNIVQSSTTQFWWARSNCSPSFLILAYRSRIQCGLLLEQQQTTPGTTPVLFEFVILV